MMKISDKRFLRVGVVLLAISTVLGGGLALSSEKPTRIYGMLEPARVIKLGTAINNFAAFLVKCTGGKGAQGAMQSLSLKRHSGKGPAKVVQVVFACFPKGSKRTAKIE